MPAHEAVLAVNDALKNETDLLAMSKFAWISQKNGHAVKLNLLEQSGLRLRLRTKQSPRVSVTAPYETAHYPHAYAFTLQRFSSLASALLLPLSKASRVCLPIEFAFDTSPGPEPI